MRIRYASWTVRVKGVSDTSREFGEDHQEVERGVGV